MGEESKRIYPPLVLAYIGDAIYEVHIRTYLIEKLRGNVNKLHKHATKYVKASAQAASVHGIKHMLSEKEWDIVKKGRNQKSNSIPKNASLVDYKYATGFEALIGYHHLHGNEARIKEIVDASILLIEDALEER
ncbi:MAG: Mini-ribonuclease 3 [Peptostreptococcaceae bacterium]|nr:Mini-ribonuclease 3 [Peptostreptococcaceae bacterium]